MKLHFDSNQDYQLEAIQSVISLFEGQPINKGDFEFSLSSEGSGMLMGELGFGNNLILSPEQILENLNAVQRKNDIPSSYELNGMNFSLEMETGTGKTYVYLRTIYELNKAYGFKKFVIVVPSIAIREGVLKNLQITYEHFQNIYSAPLNYDVYDSKKISSLRSFALNNNIQILVINIDSFAKDDNVINRANDKLSGRKPIEFIQASNPIVILDEPQNMETSIRKEAVKNLNPLLTLRYSATHKFPYNLIYKLDPVKAYDMGLVKQIEVDSIIAEDANNHAYISLEGFKSTKTKISAKIKIDVNSGDEIKRKEVTVNTDDDLYKISNYREIYKDRFVIEGIDGYDEEIKFANGIIVRKGEAQGGFGEEIMKEQLKNTIEEHFRKQASYKSKNIKVLSLFFIDKVANYRFYDEDGNPQKGKFAKWFEELFEEIKNKKQYENVIPYEVKDVHNGYFAQDKKGHFKDTKGESEADNDTYKLIMQEKERLLDLSVPLSFIFSHSALREGWDNPNVFQICTLNETKSELKKRQEIGRGLRLAVDQTGNRIFDKNINRLTVFANESYEDFAKQLQQEIEDDFGVQFKGRIKNARKKADVKLKKKYIEDKNFIELWNKIKYKTIYNVVYSSDKLIENSIKEVKRMPEIKKPYLKHIRAAIEVSDVKVEGVVRKSERIKNIDEKNKVIPDIIGYIQNKTELTRTTIFKILEGAGRNEEILINPQMYLDSVSSIIRNEMEKLMIDGIKYQKIAGKVYEMTLFEEGEIETFKENLYKVNNQEKTLYNYIEFSSEIERKFAEDCENNESVEFYVKLPRSFKIDTPLGPYNPDWALIFKNESKIYFVAETKGSTDSKDLRAREKGKIECGEKHFKEFDDVTFKKVTKVIDLL